MVLTDDQESWARLLIQRPHLISIEHAKHRMVCLFRSASVIRIAWSGAVTYNSFLASIKPPVAGQSADQNKDSSFFLYSPWKVPAILHFNADIEVNYRQLIDQYYMPVIRGVFSSETFGQAGFPSKAECMRALWNVWDNAFIQDNELQHNTTYQRSLEFFGERREGQTVICAQENLADDCKLLMSQCFTL